MLLVPPIRHRYLPLQYLPSQYLPLPPLISRSPPDLSQSLLRLLLYAFFYSMLLVPPIRPRYLPLHYPLPPLLSRSPPDLSQSLLLSLLLFLCVSFYSMLLVPQVHFLYHPLSCLLPPLLSPNPRVLSQSLLLPLLLILLPSQHLHFGLSYLMLMVPLMIPPILPLLCCRPLPLALPRRHSRYLPPHLSRPEWPYQLVPLLPLLLLLNIDLPLILLECSRPHCPLQTPWC
mmetsp:Transcript_10326/g.15121  ORF Transcript_10326/g.15121 Transcript_10326/m.15121 type:complete len:230 (-) Transcript_10326:512-1201(-)